MQDKRLEEKQKENKTSQVRNQFILMMNQQKVIQKQQSNVPFYLGEKNDEKCKIKDMIYPFNRNEKRKKKRKKKDKKKVSVSIAIAGCHFYTYLYHGVFLQPHTMHNDGWAAGGLNNLVPDTCRPYQLGRSLWYLVPNWHGHHKERYQVPTWYQVHRATKSSIAHCGYDAGMCQVFCRYNTR